MEFFEVVRSFCVLLKIWYGLYGYFKIYFKIIIEIYNYIYVCMLVFKLLNMVYFIFLDIGFIFSMCILIFFFNYINIYFKKDKVKGYKGF